MSLYKWNGNATDDYNSKHARSVRHEEYLIKSLSERLANAKSIGKRDRFGKRIQNAKARLMVLLLTKP